MEPNQTDMPTTTPIATPPADTGSAKTSYGTLIALMIVVLAIAGAALYFLNERMNMIEDAGAAALTEQSESTEGTAIEADLSAESPDDFDRDVDAAFTELDASFESN